MMDAYTHLDMTSVDPIEDLRVRMASAGVERALIVETWGKDNLACLERVVAERSREFRVGLCFRPDEERPGMDALKHEMVGALRVKTADIRRLGKMADALQSSGKWLLPHAESGIKALKDELLALAKEQPDLGIYLPHCGWPVPDGKVNADWQESIAALSELDNIIVGVSAVSYFSREAYPHSDIKPIAKGLIDTFGPESMVAGSDYPLFQKDMYGEYMGLAQEWIQQQSPILVSRFEFGLFGCASQSERDAGLSP
jgi:predicted TIM-barrel fold metal-dependent hydrolase